jgi:hypothetical protein
MDANCSNIVVCFYWTKEMEEKLAVAEEMLNDTEDYDSLITENTEACCTDTGCLIF